MTELVLPGLMDVHTHLRVPGGEHKENFDTGTAAALAGGITLVLGMPNTSPPLTTIEAIALAQEEARRTTRCDVGLFAGASAEDVDQLSALGERAVALKIYLNDTFGKLRVDDVPTLRTCFDRWPHHKLIAMHAEKQSVAVGIGFSAVYDRHVHFCHISRHEEIELIADAKGRGLKVTCEVTPHHLFLSQADATRLGPFGDMRPLLGTADDVATLWQHLDDTIDCIATDHAPHTRAEKLSATPPPGVPGLETSLPLMLSAVVDGRLSIDRLIALMHDNPRRIYNLPEQPDTSVTVEMEPYHFAESGWQTRCDWSAFAGMWGGGRVRKVVLRGEVAYEDGLVLARPGSGRAHSQRGW